jgi:ubiquinone/menaquinone biosynthesis C-methylase UbiE
MPGFDHFTHLAPFYDRVLNFEAHDSLLNYGSFSTDNLVLDVGGGTGRVASAIKPYVRDVIVADVSAGMLIQASKKGLSVLLTPAEFLAFSNGIFDRIIMIDALHHVYDQGATANELWRILAPGGIILIEEPDIRKSTVRLIALAEKLAFMRSHFISPPKIADLFRLFTSNLEVKDEGTNSWIIVKK